MKLNVIYFQINIYNSNFFLLINSLKNNFILLFYINGIYYNIKEVCTLFIFKLSYIIKMKNQNTIN